MKLKLTATTDNRLIRMLRRYARKTRDSDVELVSDASQADVIVFAEAVDWRDPHFHRVQRHRLLRRYPEKVVLFNEADRSRARLPALAVNALDVPWQIGIGSLPIHEDQKPIERIVSAPTELMSFVGSRSSRVRERILDRYAPTQRAVIDTDTYDAWHCTPAERDRQRQTFESAMAAGLFTLCPKGVGTTSLRLYESMQAGRCPVILADDWVEDTGVDWSFALRVAEKDHDRLENILDSIARNEALERGAEGRRQWDAAYSPTRYIHTLAHAAQRMVERGVTIPPRTPRELVEDSLYTGYLRARCLKLQLEHPSQNLPVEV